jgi:monofunctional biosynthetic peptidoglycan transglycosylase
MSRRTAGRPLGRLLRRAVLGGLLLLLLPAPVALLLRIADPPTTAIMLARTLQRLEAGKAPAYPRRHVVSRDAIPPALYRAVLAAEDDRFYLHHGFDFVEIDKALAARRAGRALRGASTISQQVAKNIFLWEGRSWVRKALEAWCTLWLEVLVPKERILDVYVNLAEWGDGVFGVEAAARQHFRRSARQLSDEQAVRLAVILPSPRRWSPNGAVATTRAQALRPRLRTPAPRPPQLAKDALRTSP